MSHHDVTIVKFLSSSSIQLLPLEDRNKSLFEPIELFLDIRMVTSSFVTLH